jgi:glycosyltransferase involved in cell wall biosynthesis
VIEPGPPRLSIGLPVFNGERYVAAALGSLLDQTFTDFELIICDNASTDATGEICRAFAAADARVQYHRNPANRGAAYNYNRTVALARAAYFKWAAHDDVCAPTFLERCVGVLDREPDTVLCHSLSEAIDDRGRVIGRYAGEVDAVHEHPAARFWRMIGTPHYCIPVFGVMRAEVLRDTPMHGEYVGADRNLLAELCLRGRIRLVPEYLFQRRHHADSSITRLRDERERLGWFNPGLAGATSYPTWRRLREYAASIGRSHLPWKDRVESYVMLLRWLGARHHTGPWNAGLLAREALDLVPGRRRAGPAAP